MSEIWIISDTHFGHANIIKYSNRPFKDVYEMNEKMVENWNSVVTEQDKVYHLGDVYFGKDINGYNPTDFFSRLNGKKRLILGNHDDGKDWNLINSFQKIMIWRIFKEFGLILSHVPLHPGSLDEDRWALNIHGHLHNNKVNDKRYRNVCVEHTNYTPINIEDLRTR